MEKINGGGILPTTLYTCKASEKTIYLLKKKY